MPLGYAYANRREIPSPVARVATRAERDFVRTARHGLAVAWRAPARTSGDDGWSGRAGSARRNAPARCSPCGARSHSPDAPAPSRIISRSRVTLATIEAAAIEATSASPEITASQSQPQSMRSRPSTNTSRGRTGSAAHRARQRPQRGAQDVVAIDARRPSRRRPRPRRWRRSLRRASRAPRRSSFLESSSPRGMRSGSRMTAAATTGPASGPRPASSQPATGQTPRFSARALAAERRAEDFLAERQALGFARLWRRRSDSCGAILRAGAAQVKWNEVPPENGGENLANPAGSPARRR